MNVDPKEAQGAARWFFGAGAAALAFSGFMAITDYKLSHSKREQILGATLRELRIAQSSLPSRVTDRRLSNSVEGFHSAPQPESAQIEHPSH